MPFDPEATLAETVEHYYRMSKQPGWGAYCARRLDELEQEKSGLYADIRDRLRARAAQEQGDDRGPDPS